MHQPLSSSPHSTPSPSQRPRGWKRRIAKACDSCRKRRTRCSGARPSCSQCTTVGADCHYSDHLNRQRRPRSTRLAPTTAGHVEDFEKSVDELESTAFCHRHSPPPQQPSSTEAGAQRTSTSPQNPSRSDGQPHAAGAGAAQGTVVVEETGELRYFGPSSSISLLSPNGFEWLESRTADTSLRQRLQLPLRGGGSWARWTHPQLQTLWPATVSTPFPRWKDAVALANDFFESYNTALPIFHPSTFMCQLGRHWARSDSDSETTTSTISDPAWSVALSSVLALAQRRRAEQNPQRPELADLAWAYAKNALEAVLTVLMQSVSLASIQALLALAWFFHGTPNPQPFFFLTASAVRLCHSAGLHRQVAEQPALMSSIDREQRIRVFWIAVMFDSTASLRTGRPCTQSVDDIGMPLPSVAPRDNLGIMVCPGGTTILNLLRARSKFAVLEGKIYDRIFAASSSKKPTQVLTADVKDLGKELDEWATEEVPGGTDSNSSRLVGNWDHHHKPYIVSLLLGYHSCNMTVHSAIWQRHFEYLRDRNSPIQRGRDLFPHSEKCLRASHEIINLLALIPQERISFMWEVVHRAAQAMILFFICILQQPDLAGVDAHFQGIHDAVAFMSRLANNTKEDCFVKPIVTVGHELARTASAAIHKGSRIRMGDDPTRPDRTTTSSQVNQRLSAFVDRQSTLPQMRPAPSPSIQAPTEPRTHDDDDGAGNITGYPSGAQDAHNNMGQGQNESMPYVHLDQPNIPGVPEGWNYDEGIFGPIDPLYELPRTFLWNWHDLSSELLRDFDFDFHSS